MIYARKRDANHNEIAAALEAVGAVMHDVSRHPGCLDLIVAFRGCLYWAEIKIGKGKLTAAEQELVERFGRAGVTLHIWRSADDALKAIGAI